MTNFIVKFLDRIGLRGRLEFLPPFNFGNNKLSGVADGEADGDAINMGQLGELADLVDDISVIQIPLRISGDGDLIAQNAIATSRAPFNLTILGVTLISREAAATVEVDILAGATFAGVASLVGEGTKPSISAAQTSEKTTFTDWTGVDVDADDYLQAKVTTETPIAVKQLDILIKAVKR